MDHGTIRVLCQVHPLIRIANVHLKWDVDLAGGVEVSIENDVIFVENRNDKQKCRVIFPPNLKLCDQSLIEPSVDEEGFIHLRIPTLPLQKTSGSHSTEVIPLPRPSSSSTLATKKLTVPLPGIGYRLQCSNCQSPLTDDVQLKRVLPLPSSSWSEAASDWYCHLHTHDGKQEIPIPRKLEPRQTDCLFASCYYSIAVSHLKMERLVVDDGIAKCLECSEEVAFIDSGMVKLWCHAIRWFASQSLCSRDEVAESVEAVSLCDAILLALTRAVDEEMSFFGKRLAFQNVDARICRGTLVVWFVGDQGFTVESDASASADVNLVSKNRCRVLYKICDSTASTKETSDVSRFFVSSAMFEAWVQMLQQSTLLLPPSFRTDAAFSIGYMSMS